MRLCPRLTERHPTASAVACGRKLPAEASARDLLETVAEALESGNIKFPVSPDKTHS